MSRTRVAVMAIAGMLAVLAFAAGITMSMRFEKTRPAPGAAALFTHSLNDADGRMQAISQWQGGLLVVNFWATWCAPCIEEMPDLQTVQAEYAGRGVTIIGIAIDNAAAVKRFRNEQKIGLPLLIAGSAGSDLARDLGNASGALPYTVLVDRSGSVVQSKLGRLKAADLRSWLDAQLDADGQPGRS